MEKKLVKGAIKSDIFDDVTIYDNFAGSSELLPVIPYNFTLIDYTFEPRDQGNRSTCAAFVGATISEILNNIKTKKMDVNMSPEYIYANRINTTIAGMTGRDVCRILSSHGCLPEIYMPYETIDRSQLIDKSMNHIAKRYRLGAPMLVLTIDALKRALYELGPCYLMLPLNSRHRRFWVKRSKSHNSPNMGHAVTVIGYNQDGFIFVNSWGPDWGDGGYGLLPYGDWKYVVECWTLLPKTDENEEKKEFCDIF